MTVPASPDLDGIRGVLSRATGNGWEAAYRQDVGALLAEVERHREDVRLAAGGLMVPIPAPGTVEARLLLANVAMRRERDEERRLSRAQDEAVGAALDAAGAPAHPRLAERVRRWSAVSPG